MLVFVSNEASSDTSKPYFGIDPLTDGVPAGGVPFLFDLFKDFQASHADTAYDDADEIVDLAEQGDGTFSITSTPQTITSGAAYGGADFSAITARGNTVRAPVGVLNAINDGSQYFAVAFWVVLPASADWNTAGTIAPFFCCTADAGGYATPEADMVTIAQQAGGSLSARRQTNGATVAAVSIALNAGAYGKLALVMFWRNAAGVGMRVKTSVSDQSTGGAVGSNNAGDFSNAQPRWGVTTSFTASADIAKLGNWTLCKGWIENLQVSGRDPATVFDAEYARVSDRIAAL